VSGEIRKCVEKFRLDFATSSIKNPIPKSVVLVKNEKSFVSLVRGTRVVAPSMPLLVVHPPLSEFDNMCRDFHVGFYSYESIDAEFEFVQFHNDVATKRSPEVRGIYYSEGSVFIGAGLKIVKSKMTGDVVAMEHIGGVEFGRRCRIGLNTVIHRAVFDFTTIGDDVHIGSNCNVGHNVRIGDRTIVASGANIGGSAVIGCNCFIGMGAIILPHVKICDWCMIGAGAVMTDDAAISGVYVGSPAKWIKTWDERW